MRKFIGGKKILWPARTRFATNFITLEIILVRDELYILGRMCINCTNDQTIILSSMNY
jgi:hypothetical protein